MMESIGETESGEGETMQDEGETRECKKAKNAGWRKWEQVSGNNKNTCELLQYLHCYNSYKLLQYL